MLSKSSNRGHHIVCAFHDVHDSSTGFGRNQTSGLRALSLLPDYSFWCSTLGCLIDFVKSVYLWINYEGKDWWDERLTEYGVYGWITDCLHLNRISETIHHTRRLDPFHRRSYRQQVIVCCCSMQNIVCSQQKSARKMVAIIGYEINDRNDLQVTDPSRSTTNETSTTVETTVGYNEDANAVVYIVVVLLFYSLGKDLLHWTISKCGPLRLSYHNNSLSIRKPW